MNKMKFSLIVLLALSCGSVWAQTNAPAKKTPSQQIEINSDSGYYDGMTNQMVYIGHVMVTDHVKAQLNCGRLTVDIPSEGDQVGGHPTNIVAEAGVEVFVTDEKGETNHVTSDRAVYSYHVVAGITNEMVVFTGGNPMPKVENSTGTILADPLVLDIVKKKFEMPGKLKMYMPIKQTGSGNTNSPFDFLK